MPYITSDGKTIHKADAIACLVDEINDKGNLNFVICELVGKLILKDNKISYTNMSNWIGGVRDAEDELRRRLLHPYEDNKIIQNGDLSSFAEISEKIMEERSELLARQLKFDANISPVS
jgi:hypothetical protein